VESYLATEMNLKLTPAGLRKFVDNSAGIVVGEELGRCWGGNKLVVADRVCRSAVVDVH
jgi:hypothetical protein